jgi:hypothetical protein
MKKHNYFINRLLEVSTWRGIYLSLGSLVAILMSEVTPKNLIIICAIGSFVVGQIMVWTRDAAETETILDDILLTAAKALKFKKSEVVLDAE